MRKIDNKLTLAIKNWLEKEDYTNEDIMQGAMYVLKLTKNQSLYNTILRRPEKYLDKVKYELSKRLPMRLDMMTASDVREMEKEFLPEVEAAVTSCDANNSTESAVAVGKRSDHEQLPEDIQALWDVNAERWKKIKELYNTCKELSKPCDRYEFLKILKETWYAYKKDFEAYDTYTIGSVNETPEESVDMVSNEISVKDITNARAYISKNLEKLESMTDKDSEEFKKLKDKVAQRIYVILNAGESFSDDMIQRLTPVFTDINFDEHQETAETAQE